MSNIRFEGAIWYKDIQTLTCSIIGVGATGSYAAFLLSRAGIKNLTLVDPDYIEVHNIGSQLFGYQTIGQSKVGAVKNMLLEYTTPKRINVYSSKVEENSIFLKSDIVLSTLDSMSGRKYMFDIFLQQDVCKIFIDSRISAEYYEIYCITKENTEAIEKYKKTLFSDAEGNMGACNYQQSSHSACMAACEITKLVTNFVTNNIIEEKEIPYKTVYDLRTSKHTIEW
tara:strand:+ start:231 stop:908 length:678 start_codon:yes stop_codon:yes gene_type:complete